MVDGTSFKFQSIINKNQSILLQIFFMLKIICNHGTEGGLINQKEQAIMESLNLHVLKRAQLKGMKKRKNEINRELQFCEH